MGSMDGHDNDEHANNASSTQGGIFSTPDLTVNDGNIAQPISNPEGERKRVASIFANTDTGRQAQRLNDAMEAQTTPITEDLVINNGPRAKSKLPLIIALVVLVVVAAGIGGWAIINSFSNNNPDANVALTPQEAFVRYKNLITYGDENTADFGSISDSDWFIFQLRNGGLNNVSMQEYINKVSQSYDGFSGIASTKAEDRGDIDMNQYARLLDLFLKGGSLKLIQQNILDEFLKRGSESAYSYIQELIPKQPDDEEYQSMIIVSDAIGTFLQDELTLLEIYEGWGCIDDNSVSMSCVDTRTVGHVAYNELADSQSAAQQTIISYLRVLQIPFVELTNVLVNMF